MDVILLTKVANLGNIGDRVKVKSGYGRNFLLPKGKATLATPENVKKFEARRAELEKVAREQFQDAVRAALRDYTRAEKLATNPLCDTHLARNESTALAKATSLQAKLREAAKALQSNPKDLKLYRALWHTYFEPLATQERVAERLGLPFSTYRHHLSRGIDSVAAWLWQHERAQPPR